LAITASRWVSPPISRTAARWKNHASTRTTQLYDLRATNSPSMRSSGS
jgi:hypothetical protein